MEPVYPNGVLRCESRRPRGRFTLGLWKYSLAFLIVTSATIDAFWLVPMEEAHQRDAAGYRDAIRARCRQVHAHESVAPAIR